MGAPLLWSPFFLIAHVIESVRATLTNAPSPTGYESIYVFITSLASIVYGFISVLLLHDMAQRFFDTVTARIAALAGWLATPLVFYMYSHPTMAHAADAFTNTLVVLMWFKLDRTSPKHWFALGALTGIAMLVRTQNALMIVIPLIALLRMFWQSLRSSLDITLSQWFRIGLAYAFGGLIGFLPQLITWRIVYGNWIELNPYAYSDAGYFTGQLQLARVLISTDRGLFLWSPVLIFSMLGLIPLYHRYRRLTIFLLWGLISQIILVSLWFTPTGASAFGARLLINNIPTFILGLAAFIDQLKARAWKVRALYTAATLFIIWNFLLILQFVTETIPRVGEFPLGDMIAGQFTVVPTQFGRIVQALVTRQ